MLFAMKRLTNAVVMACLMFLTMAPKGHASHDDQEGDYRCRYALEDYRGNTLDYFEGRGPTRYDACRDAQMDCYAARRTGEICEERGVEGTCIERVKRIFSDGMGIEVTEHNHPNGSPKHQCNTSCHWAGFPLGCADSDCNVVVHGSVDHSLCTSCRYEKEVTERVPCR